MKDVWRAKCGSWRREKIDRWSRQEMLQGVREAAGRFKRDGLRGARSLSERETGSYVALAITRNVPKMRRKTAVENRTSNVLKNIGGCANFITTK